MEMTTYGMSSEFATEDSDEDNEVIIGSQNNNASPGNATNDRANGEDEEEGEISEDESGEGTSSSDGDDNESGSSTEPEDQPQPSTSDGRRGNSKKRKSVDDIQREIQQVNKAMAKMQRLMTQTLEQNRRRIDKGENKNSQKKSVDLSNSESESTIYKSAVKPANAKNRVSTSSEDELIDTSDELIQENNTRVDNDNQGLSNMIDVLEIEAATRFPTADRRDDGNQARAGTSQVGANRDEGPREGPRRRQFEAPADRAERMIREAEEAKI